MENKPFYASKTIWGLAVMIAALVLPKMFAGEDKTALASQLADWALVIGEIIGGILVVVGRLKANTKLTPK